MNPTPSQGDLFRAYAVLYDVLSEPHSHRGVMVRDLVARGAFASRLRPVDLVVDHDEAAVIAHAVELIADHVGVRLACRPARLPDTIRGLSVQYANARWRRDGNVWTLLDGEIAHVSLASAKRPAFPCTFATCSLGGLRLST